MKNKSDKKSKRFLNTHLTLLIGVVIVFILIVSFVIYTNSKTNNTNNSSNSVTSSSNGDILSDAISTYNPNNTNTSAESTGTVGTEVEDNIMNNEPIVNNKFIANYGDSLAIITRGYIKDYLSSNNIELTKTQRIYIEGVYISNRGYPLLNIGENVEIDKNEIVSIIAKSKTLSSKTLDIWAVYARNIT